jgi:phage tail sheath protein FI
MPSVFLSPGVYSSEVDLSQIIGQVATSSAAIVGASPKGRVPSLASELVLITTAQQFLDHFCVNKKPEVGNNFQFSALAYLTRGNQLWCARVVNGAVYAGCTILTSGAAGSNSGLPASPTVTDYTVYTFLTDELLLITAANQGVWGNDIAVRITNIDATLYTFDVEVWDRTVDGSTYVQKETFTVSRKQQVDGFGKNQYIEDVINAQSTYIRVNDNTAEVDTVLPKEQATDLAFLRGANGSAVTNTEVNAGWDLFANPDDVDVRLLINAGYVSSGDAAVQTKMIAIAEGRLDCLALLDMPPSLTVTAMNAHRTTTLNANSSYAALYTDQVKQHDQWADRVFDAPPSGYIAAICAHTDNVTQVSFAPAGLNRGVLENIGASGISTIFSLGNRNLLYPNQVNPLHTFKGSGSVPWGQKTLQTKQSALSSVNVRRMLIVLEKAIAAAVNFLVFEPNDAFTRTRVLQLLEPYLADKQAKRWIYRDPDTGADGYRVVCDTTNNTPTVIDNNELHIDIYIKPTKAAEFIQLQAIVTSTGASFEELVSTGGAF